MNSVLEEQLRRELEDQGIFCDACQASLLIRHLMLVIDKNRSMNLTRITDPADAVTLHVVDSLLSLACSGVSLSVGDSFVDMGTGGGFPGICLGIMTGARGLLVDSVGKKVLAVREFIDELGLHDLSATKMRLEELPLMAYEPQDYVVARAVAQSNILIEYAAPLLKNQGILILEKARPTVDEFNHADKAAQICGMSLVSRETFELRDALGHREIILYRKTRPSRITLPRKVGVAKQKPLGE